MKKTRFLTISLALLLTVAVLTGCGSGGGASAASGSGAEITAPQGEADLPAPPSPPDGSQMGTPPDGAGMGTPPSPPDGQTPQMPDGFGGPGDGSFDGAPGGQGGFGGPGGGQGGFGGWQTDQSSAPQIQLSDPTDGISARSGGIEPEAGWTVLELSDATGDLTISQAGTYLLRGSLTDGQIRIDAPKGARVELILDGVSIEKSGHAALYAVKAGELILRSAPGSVNVLRSVGAFVQTDDNEVDGALFSKCDLLLSGEGTLALSCEQGHGAVGKDDVTVEGGTLLIRAASKGLSGKDSLSIQGGSVTVSAEGKGLFSGGDADKGETGRIEVSGGSLTVEALDDGLHAGNVSITDGALEISSGDDGIHADESLTVSGGSIRILQSYEGLEAETISVSGGEHRIVSADDGLNAAGGSDGSNAYGRFGGDPFGTDNAASLEISGGTLWIDAEGDGLDSNGALLVSGGAVYVSGPTWGGNGAIDYGSSGTVTGGTVIAAGAAGMAENFGPGSTQGSILLNVGDQAAGSPVSICDESGQVLASFTPAKAYQCVVLSCPGIRQGGTYTVTAGSFSQTLTLESLLYGSGGGFGGQGGPGGGQGGHGGGFGGQGGGPGGRP